MVLMVCLPSGACAVLELAPKCAWIYAGCADEPGGEGASIRACVERARARHLYCADRAMSPPGPHGAAALLALLLALPMACLARDGGRELQQGGRRVVWVVGGQRWRRLGQ